MSRRFVVAAVLAAFVMAGGTADAGQLLATSSASFANERTDLTGAPVLTVNQYGGTGLVTSVVVTLTAKLQTSGTITNTGSRAATNVWVNVEVGEFTVDPGSGAPSALTSLQPFVTSAVLVDEVYGSILPEASVSFSETIDGVATATLTGDDLAGFLGTGTFSMNPFSEIWTSFGGRGGNLSFVIETVAGATLTVQYFGEELVEGAMAAPEPSTLALALAGLGVLGLGRLVRRSRKAA